ncbi:MFS transporter [Zwartia sp.]|uniref:MFS transporter n=1 Tax=Zwartia sp. TaxID=2978004 RepID=UPI0027199040|nr:MFS transporter [Zwartia sp.]MDO9025814.1 MFS transporter [Zwartia sp.]
MTTLASQTRENLRFPVFPLIATLATQSLATMAAYSFPVVAPVIAKDLQVPGTLVGFFISTVYGVGIISAVLSPRFIRRFGAVRVSQLVLIATLAMLLACSVGSVVSIVIGAALLGLAYGATAPASAHLLVPRTPPRVMNLVLSIRQIGVPLGGVMAGLLMAPMTLSLGWQTALLWQTVPVVIAVLLLECARRDWDSDRDPTRQIMSKGLLAPVQILFDRPELRRLAVASFVYSGLQLCFIAFLTVHLTSKTSFNLVQAGWALAVYQLAAVVSRPIWGWLADKWFSAKLLLAWQGFIMGAAALLAGQFTESWSSGLVLLLCAVAGATASGFTGLAYAEWARLGGAQRTEATGLGSGLMFAGVLLLPSLFSVAVTYFDDFGLAYAVVGGLAAMSGWLLWRQKGI